MQRIKRTAAVLIWPAIAWLGTACDQPNEPTGAPPTPEMQVTAAATLVVDDDGVQCPNRDHNTISAAVAASSSGDIIQVCAGDYTETVTITHPLTLLGPNAGTSWDGSRGAEAFVTSPATTFFLASQDVTIDGFTITGNLAIYVSGSSTGTVIENNIITGVLRALTLDATLASSASNNVSVLNNNLISNSRTLHVDGAYTNMEVSGNRFFGPGAAPGIFFTGPFLGAPAPNEITGFEFTDNEVLQQANMASNISNATVSDNTFDVAPPGDEILLISLHNSTVTDNSFEGNDGIACLRLWGSEFGFDPSNHVTISDNTFSDCGRVLGPTPSSNYAIQLGPDVHHIDIRNNEIDDGVEGVNTGDQTPWDVTQEIHINFNNITDNVSFGVRNGQSGILDAECNWWGAADGPGPVGPGSGDNVSTNVDFTPWLIAPAPGGACVGGVPSGKVTGGGQITASGGKGTFGFSVKSEGGVGSGHLNYMNHVTRAHLNCRVTFVTELTATTAKFEGTCSSKTYTGDFKAEVEDHGEPGKNRDKFTIRYGGNSDGDGTTIRSGNIQIHN